MDTSIFKDKDPVIDELLLFCTENNCSDLYIKVGRQPYITRYGKINKVPCKKVTRRIWNEWAKFAISSEDNSKYVTQKMLDTSYVIEIHNGEVIPHDKDVSDIDESEIRSFRYRMSCGFSTGKNIATFRMITEKLPSFKHLEFPEKDYNALKQISKSKTGITLFVGATGSGKSTTMTAMINDFTKRGETMSNSVIITLEDPIEYIYDDDREWCNITQKELGKDFKAFASGVKQALREHPTFINVGETRDNDTIKALVEASRTGHGVYSSYHASDVADAISRIYNSLSTENPEVMYDLIANINMILCQRIIANGSKFKLETQYLIFNPSIVKHLNSAIQEGKNIPVEIRKIFNNQAILRSNLAKDWS